MLGGDLTCGWLGMVIREGGIRIIEPAKMPGKIILIFIVRVNEAVRKGSG